MEKLDNQEEKKTHIIYKPKKLLVFSNIFSSLDKIREEKHQQKTASEKSFYQGFLFGNENSDCIEITSMHSLLENERVEDAFEEHRTLKIHLERSRMNFTPVGLYFVSEKNNLPKNILSLALHMQIYNPQSLLLFYNPLVNLVSIKKLKAEIIDAHFQAEIRNYHEEYVISVFNKQYTSDILDDVEYTRVQDIYSVFTSLNHDTHKVMYEKDDNLEKEKNKIIKM